MDLDLSNPTHQLATLVVVIEIILYLFLLLAVWYVKRLKLDQKIKIVYSIVFINLFIWLFYMSPKGLSIVREINLGTFDPFQFWYLVLHGIIGFITMILAIFILLVFFKYAYSKEIIPLSLIRKMKPIMITTFIFWTLTMVLGISIYINFYLFTFL